MILYIFWKEPIILYQEILLDLFSKNFLVFLTLRRMLHLEHRPAPPPTTTTTPKPVKDIEDKTDAMSEMNTLDMSSKGGSNKTKQTKKKLVQNKTGLKCDKMEFPCKWRSRRKHLFWFLSPECSKR